VLLQASLLVAAYQAGYFPMARESGQIHWYSPDPRGILPIEAYHPSRRLLRVVRAGRFDVTVDTAFRDVMLACAADRDEGTWINGDIVASYCALHDVNLAHSIEVWQEGALVGGLYGVSVRGAFFGESMFHRVTDASKVALWRLCDILGAGGYRLLDIQWLTPFLARVGAIEIPRDDYLNRLQAAMRARIDAPCPEAWITDLLGRPRLARLDAWPRPGRFPRTWMAFAISFTIGVSDDAGRTRCRSALSIT
jgi:leucyl/phenylalanyl-tRNA--protein transferase